MPYPLSKLAYGLRYRLSELATPVERYNLQLAAGNASICPANLQLIKKLSGNPDFFSENGTVTMFHSGNTFENETELVFEEKSLFMAVRSIYLTGFSSQDFKSKIFNHILFKLPCFVLEECCLSKLFYTTFERAYPNVKTLAILNYTNVLYKFNLRDVLNVFNHLKELTVYCCTNSNWITEVLQSRNRSLMNLTLNFTTESATFERFKPDDLLTLLNAQQRGFKLWIQVEDKPAKFKTYFSQLKQFLDKNLAQGSSRVNCTTVSILYGTHLKRWHVPFINVITVFRLKK